MWVGFTKCMRARSVDMDVNLDCSWVCVERMLNKEDNTGNMKIKLTGAFLFPRAEPLLTVPMAESIPMLVAPATPPCEAAPEEGAAPPPLILAAIALARSSAAAIGSAAADGAGLGAPEEENPSPPVPRFSADFIASYTAC